jgi:VanZ family protein
MWRWRVALVCWMGMIFVLSSSQFASQMSYDNTVNWFGMLNYVVRKCAHVAEYAVLAWFWFRSIRAPGERVGRSVVVACGLTLIYAMSDEWHQSFIPERSGAWSDVLLDGVGAVGMGLLLRRSLDWEPSLLKGWLVGAGNSEPPSSPEAMTDR